MLNGREGVEHLDIINSSSWRGPGLEPTHNLIIAKERKFSADILPILLQIKDTKDAKNRLILLSIAAFIITIYFAVCTKNPFH